MFHYSILVGVFFPDWNALDSSMQSWHYSGISQRCSCYQTIYSALLPPGNISMYIPQLSCNQVEQNMCIRSLDILAEYTLLSTSHTVANSGPKRWAVMGDRRRYIPDFRDRLEWIKSSTLLSDKGPFWMDFYMYFHSVRWSRMCQITLWRSMS